MRTTKTDSSVSAPEEKEEGRLNIPSARGFSPSPPNLKVWGVAGSSHLFPCAQDGQAVWCRTTAVFREGPTLPLVLTSLHAVLTVP
jgi:hypothetical protein